MESVLESVFVPCQNAELGCTKNVSYGKQSSHDPECIFSRCTCPAQGCNLKPHAPEIVFLSNFFLALAATSSVFSGDWWLVASLASHRSPLFSFIVAPLRCLRFSAKSC
ncbi:hypothetical protein ARALYDRAFT_915960 [Arabidopsis lyrata subsp. lyrata]|uniref:SIAH-type domain-containing protein n=1 Tax=Arabidopsis lyrata subsp. lyrata TaxID=81972 RepID=D7MIK4_ARALL|nr:hypothetical protein ARALYDRAFT_915960 [Arabidopsis lyrata subsp. lyrata]